MRKTLQSVEIFTRIFRRFIPGIDWTDVSAWLTPAAILAAASFSDTFVIVETFGKADFHRLFQRTISTSFRCASKIDASVPISITEYNSSQVRYTSTELWYVLGPQLMVPMHTTTVNTKKNTFIHYKQKRARILYWIHSFSLHVRMKNLRTIILCVNRVKSYRRSIASSSSTSWSYTQRCMSNHGYDKVADNKSDRVRKAAWKYYLLVFVDYYSSRVLRRISHDKTSGCPRYQSIDFMCRARVGYTRNFRLRLFFVSIFKLQEIPYKCGCSALPLSRRPSNRTAIYDLARTCLWSVYCNHSAILECLTQWPSKNKHSLALRCYFFFFGVISWSQDCRGSTGNMRKIIFRGMFGFLGSYSEIFWEDLRTQTLP